MNKINRIQLLVLSIVMLMLLTINGRVNAATLSVDIIGSRTTNIFVGRMHINSITITNTGTDGFITLYDAPSTNTNFYVSTWSNVVYVATNYTIINTNVLTGVKQTNVWNGLVPVWQVIPGTNYSYPVVLQMSYTNKLNATIIMNKYINNGLLLTLSAQSNGFRIDYSNIQ